MEKTTLYLPVGLQAELRALARRSGRPQAELIREAVADYVARQDHPWPSSIGSADDAAVSGESSEDWLREEWSRDDARPMRRSARL
ncbi:MAG: CopG family transcriptional regulator [Anaerolinea sp.]|nr:CopG family transcriptional regulator [Anaerolinea sp.]